MVDAIAIPCPESRSVPADMMSSADSSIATRTWSGDGCVGSDSASAAIAAACGAAAEVPQKGLKPVTAVGTQSAAVTSTFGSTVPPLVAMRKLPGVIDVPLGLKKMRRGPSEL